jgi:hypothetical protein
MERAGPYRHVGPVVMPRHGPVSITQVVTCRWPVGPIVLGQPKAQKGFWFLFFPSKFCLLIKTNLLTSLSLRLKNDFILNFKIKLFYTIFIGRVLLCRAGLIGPGKSCCAIPSPVGLARPSKFCARPCSCQAIWSCFGPAQIAQPRWSGTLLPSS